MLFATATTRTVYVARPLFSLRILADMAHSQSTSSPTATMEKLNQIAQDYYDSDDAFNFYKHIWGGESIHVGLYDTDEARAINSDVFEKVKIASRLATQRLYNISGQTLTKDSRICDFGSAYGGTARYAAQTFGSTVLCVDVSSKENAYNRAATKQAGLSDLVLVPKDQSYFDVDAPDASFDLVVSQDSLLHAGPQRHRAIQEASRLLKKGGFLVFTDIMQSEHALPSELELVYKRIKLDDMGTPTKYETYAQEYGMKKVQFEDRTSNLAAHYGAVHDILEARRQELTQGILSETFMDNMLAGLQAWLDAAGRNKLRWGFMLLQKE